MSQSDFISFIDILLGVIVISSFGKIDASFVVPHVYILGLIWFCHFVLFHTSVYENMFHWGLL